MIHINIVRDNKGFIWEFTVKGHAGAGKLGKDIVCAAISAVAFTALGALDELTGIKNYFESDGFIRCTIPTDVEENKANVVKIILETMAIGFKQIENEYKKFVRVLDEEV
jgi:uncharacterized protein